MLFSRGVKVKKSVLSLFKEYRVERCKNDKAIVGILASKNRVIDSVYFVEDSGGCRWFPNMYSSDIAKAVCRAVKDRRKIKGLVVVNALGFYDECCGSGEGDTDVDVPCYLFRQMIVGDVWRGLIYIVCGKEIFTYKVVKGKEGGEVKDYKLVKLVEV